jgi:hypothetical protein
MDPAAAGAGVRILAAIRNWPLWILFAVALSLTAILAVPDFRTLASPIGTVGLACAVVVAWIFTVARAVEPTFAALSAYRRQREEKRNFFVSPIEQQCHWSIAKQVGGSYVTQFAMHCLIKNRSSQRLYPTNARVIRPKIRGEVIPNPTVFIEGPDNVYGTAAISRNHIRAGDTSPVLCNIMIRGTPRRRSGNIRAIIEISDADGHHERVKRFFGISGSPRHRCHVQRRSLWSGFVCSNFLERRVCPNDNQTDQAANCMGSAKHT